MQKAPAGGCGIAAPAGAKRGLWFCSGIQCRCLPEVCGLIVEALIALGRDIPAEVALHVVLDEVMPVFLAVVAVLCAAAGIVQLVGAVAREGEAIALAEGAVVDGVAQTTGLADDGRRR